MVGRRPRSLQSRLLWATLLVVAAVWAGAATAVYLDAQHELDELLDGHLAQAASLLIVQQVHELDEGEEHSDVKAPLLHRYAPRVAFQVWHQGRLMVRSDQAPSEPMARVIPPFDEGFLTASFGGRPWRLFSARDGQRDLQVVVGEQLTARQEILLAVMRGTLWPMALALPVLAGVLWWAVRQGLAPLRELSAWLGTREPEALHPIAMARAPSEIRPVVDALNSLFGQIQHLIESERRFTADAAHELRTPLAALRAQAQVALASQGDDERRHALRATLEGCDRASHLVDQLLTLSRLEAMAPEDRRAVDMAALVRRVAGELAPRAIDKHQELDVDIGTISPVVGSDTLLAVLVRNLVDNASRYSPPGARIQIRLSRKPLAAPGVAGPDSARAVESPAPGANEVPHTGLELEVEDSGPGLEPDARDRLGERFFRVLGTDESGSGLGWSIVRRIAAAHHLSIAIGSSDALGGLHVRVSWPPDGRGS